MEGSSSNDSKIKVFISYSRRDGRFVQEVARALNQQNFDVLIDRESIEPGEAWRQRLGDLIVQADAFLLVITDRSLTSPVCQWEIDHARQLNKKIIPLKYGPSTKQIPKPIAALNFVFADDPKTGRSKPARPSSAAVEKLVRALYTDIDWVREHTRLSALAEEWRRAEANRKSELLLRAGEVERARERMALRPAGAVPISETLAGYLDASAERERLDRERLLKITGRAFVVPAEQAVENQEFDRALRLAAAGAVLSDDVELKRTPRLARAARNAVSQVGKDRLRARLSYGWGAKTVLCSPDGAHAIVAGSSGANLYDTANCNLLRSFPDIGIEGVISCDPHWRCVAGATLEHAVKIYEIRTGLEYPTLRGHSGEITHVALEGAGELIATASGDGTSRLWNRQSGEQVLMVDHRRERRPSEEPTMAEVIYSIRRIMGGNEVNIDSMALDFPRRRWITGDVEGCLRVSDTAGTRPALELVGHTGRISSIVMSNDGHHILTSGNGFAKVWNAETGESVLNISDHNDPIDHAYYDRAEARIITTGAKGSIKFWLRETGDLVAELSGDGKIVRLCLDASGEKMLTLSSAGMVQLWDLPSADLAFAFKPHSRLASGACLTSDASRVFTTCEDESPAVWDAATSAIVARYLPVGDHKTVAQMSLDGQNMVLAAGGGHSEIRLFHSTSADPVGWSPLSRATSSGGAVFRTALSASGEYFAAIAKNVAEVWESRSGQRVSAMETPDELFDIVFCADEARLLLKEINGSVSLWEWREPRRVAQAERGDQTASFLCTNGRHVALTSIVECTVWDTVTDLRRTLRSARGVQKLALSGDGRRLATGSIAGVGVWSLEEVELVQMLMHVGSELLALNGPGDALIESSRGMHELFLWDVAEKKKRGVLRGHSDHVREIRFSSDDVFAVSASLDRNARMWDVATCQPCGVLVHSSPVRSARFLKGNNFVVTQSGKGELAIWDASRAEYLRSETAVLVAAGLEFGRGQRLAEEKRDLIMELAPENNFAAMIELLSSSQRGEVERVARGLMKPLHARCYQSASRLRME